jgi:hypothetical protein
MRVRPLVVLAALATAALVLATPALASTAARALGGLRGGPAFRGATTSTTFAGYEIGAIDGPSNMTTTIVLPKLNCGTTDQAIYPSVGAYFDLGSSDFSSAGMFVGCIGGKAQYWPVLQVNGVEHDYPTLIAKKGDTVVLKYSMKSGATKVSVTDKTTKSASKKLTGTGVTETGFPWAGDVAWHTGLGALEGVPKFGTLTFSHTVFVGVPFETDGPTQFNRYSGSTLQISTGSFASDEETFKTTFHHS